ARVEVGRLGGVWQGVRDTFTHWWLVLRCSAIGTFVSIIPGMGAATTQWLAYAHAAQSSPGRERFGRGAVEGVLGPGAANNSTLGGSLVTTVAFGVPASVTMAILMGAFLIQGLVPGPSMLTPAPKGHLTLTLSMVWTIVVSDVIQVGSRRRCRSRSDASRRAARDAPRRRDGVQRGHRGPVRVGALAEPNVRTARRALSLGRRRSGTPPGSRSAHARSQRTA